MRVLRQVLLEFELMTEEQLCAQELCGALLHHVLRLTNSKRQVLEDPHLYGRKLRAGERRRRDAEITWRMSRAPGKLDHASIVAFEVGVYRGDADESYEYGSDAAENDVIYGSHVGTIHWDGTLSGRHQRRRVLSSTSSLVSYESSV